MATTKKKKYDTGVYPLPSGNWAYRFKITVDGEVIAQRRTKDVYGVPYLTKKAAVDARRAAIKAAKAKEPIDGIPIAEPKTVKEVFLEYCEKGRADRAYNTILKQNSLWNNYLRDKFGDRCVEDISVGEVQDYLTYLYREKGYAYRYVESFLKMFYLIFGQAYSRDYMSQQAYNKMCVNKDTKIRMPKSKVDERLDIIAFTRDECAVMDEHFSGSNAETAYLLGRMCGLRINECFGLKWDCVDLENKTIRIERQMQYQNGIIKLVTLKTKNAYRTIHMNERMHQHLTAVWERRKEAEVVLFYQRQQNQTMIEDVDGTMISSLELVNSLPNGHIQTVSSMKYHSRELKAKGINFKYHHLRHTYGTHLADMNIPPHLLCNQMGHGKIETTRRYYIAVSEDGIAELKRGIELL